MKYTTNFGSRSACTATALLCFLSWAKAIDAIAAQPSGAASGSNISVCNGYSTRISVALASQNQGNFNAAGWWSVDPNTCEPADFSFQGAALYYAADANQYHWGNKVNLYVSPQKFNYDNAQLNRNGAHSEMFSSLELTAQQQNSTVTITFHFIPGNTTTDITIKK